MIFKSLVMPTPPHSTTCPIAIDSTPAHCPTTFLIAAQSVSSEKLLGAKGELKIQHNGELYSLRRTRQGKLILTK